MNTYTDYFIGGNYDGCPVCEARLEAVGPLHGPERPPAVYTGRPRMTPQEWAGEGSVKFWGR